MTLNIANGILYLNRHKEIWFAINMMCSDNYKVNTCWHNNIMKMLQKKITTMREFHHGSGFGQLMTNYQWTKLTEKDYVMQYLISTTDADLCSTKNYAVLKHSISLMRIACVNFAKTLAAIFMKDIVRRWCKCREIYYYYYNRWAGGSKLLVSHQIGIFSVNDGFLYLAS